MCSYFYIEWKPDAIFRTHSALVGCRHSQTMIELPLASKFLRETNFKNLTQHRQVLGPLEPFTMISLRCLGRSAPRKLLRLNAQLPQRTFSTIRQSPLLQLSCIGASRARHAAFSTSRPAWEKEGQGRRCSTMAKPLTDSSPVDQELSAKFESELRIEKEARDSNTLPPNIQEFLDNSPFEVRNQAHKQYH